MFNKTIDYLTEIAAKIIIEARLAPGVFWTGLFCGFLISIIILLIESSFIRY